MELTRKTYEEYFLLYVDNELSAAERHGVERFVHDNPDLAQELDALKTAVLTMPEEIRFENKEILFRKENKEAVVLSFAWWRVAAAAVVLLFLGTAVWMFVNLAETRNGSLAVTDQKKNENTKQATTAADPGNDRKIANTKTEVEKKQNNSGIADLNKTIIKNNSSNKSVTPGRDSRADGKALVNNNKNRPAAQRVASKNIEPATAKSSVNRDLAITAEASSLKPLSDSKLVATADPLSSHTSTGMALPVSGRELDPVETREDRKGEMYAAQPQRNNVIYVANTAINKNSLRGIFRKASRLVERVASLNAPEPTNEVAMLKQ